MYKIIGADGQQYGPVTADQIRRWLTERRVTPQTLVLAEGAQDWQPLSSVAEFAADFKTPPPLSTPPPQIAASAVYDPRASNKVAAGVFGIILGAFGIHKFILGYPGAGLIMLLITLLTCGLAYPLMHLLGLIEGIIYLSKPDPEFVRLYVDGRKEWF